MTILLTDEQAAAVREALAINRVMARDSNGDYIVEVTPKLITEALAILDSAQRVEVVGNLIVNQHADSFIAINFTIPNPEEVLSVGQSVYAVTGETK